MTDSDEIDERVTALFELLEARKLGKVKKCAEDIADAAGDDEPIFEASQIVHFLHVWLDVVAGKLDDEIITETGRALQNLKPEEDECAHPGLAEVLVKVARALETASDSARESMGIVFMVRLMAAKFTGDREIYGPFFDLIRHPKSEALHDCLEAICGGKFLSLAEGPDEETALILKHIFDLADSMAIALKNHKAGDSKLSKLLAHQMSCVSGLLSSVDTFCAMLLTVGSSMPKAREAAARPASVMELESVMGSLSLKPKDKDLKNVISTVRECCASLMSNMPQPKAGTATDPAGDGKKYLKALADAQDSGNVAGCLNMLMSSTDPKSLDTVLHDDGVKAVLDAMKRVKVGEYDVLWQRFIQFFAWAAEQRPTAVEKVAEPLAAQFMQGPLVFMNPSAFLQTMAETAPAVSKAIWTKRDLWMKTLRESKGGVMFDAVLIQVSAAFGTLPKALSGSDLETLCKVLVDVAAQGKGGGQMGDAVAYASITSLRSVLAKDKARIPGDVLDWVKQQQSAYGSVRDAATAFMDAYEGRSLAGAYSQIEDANARFKEACGNMEGLKAYVDQNVSDLKDFIGEVTKKLPLPVKFTSEPRYVVKKAMILHFECHADPKATCCALPEGTFTIETLEWSRWLKMSLSAAKLGKAVLTAEAIADVPGVVEQVKGMYSLYSAKDDADFLTFISEPFLTSEEQDKLINQLRSGGYFSKFKYDNQTAKWVCANCHAIYSQAGSSRDGKAITAAESELATTTLPLTEDDMKHSDPTLVQNLEQAKDIGMKGKEVCCSFWNMCRPEES
eukprot:TRINITY_DN36874_c0_g1_i1.p1 TRINITY_DN36874_c0_g1~~TRINITY_DN36874_c0_g1_i1.p1  ORF type:complete len:808 (+),score=161.38 TRINITY_DN36874_c0_g1_i1:54-2426(+)